MSEGIISINEYKDYYDKELFDKFGFDIKSVDTSKKETQYTRFNTLVKIGVEKNDSVLDVCCGMGDLAGFFLDKKLGIKYTGFDVSNKFIRFAKEKYENLDLGGMKINFEVEDLLEYNKDKKYDWVLISGYNLITIELIKKYFKIARKGLAFNSLSSYAEWKNKLFPYRDPYLSLRLIKEKISPWVVLRHDYLPHDFTIYVYKNPNSMANK